MCDGLEFFCLVGVSRMSILSLPVCAPVPCRKKERKRTTQKRDGRTARRHHTGISLEGRCVASRRPPLGVRLFLSLFAVLLRFSLQPYATSRSPPSRRGLPCRFFLCRVALLCLVLRRRRRLPLPCSRCSAQLCPPCCISWPLKSIELSSSKDESSDAHCYHLPPSHIDRCSGPLSLRTLVPPRMKPALGSPSGAS